MPHPSSPAPAVTRRAALGTLAGLAGAACLSPQALSAGESKFRLATFAADVTPPLGHPLLAGATTCPPANRIDDPLWARGFVLLGGERPVVVVSVDWCEIRNDAYDRWRDVLAEAAGTDRARVLVTSIHQHDVPLPDLEAERILRRHGAQTTRIIDLDYHEQTVQAVAEALKKGLAQARPVDRLGIGQARVKDVASNRRFLGADGKPRHDRSSMSGAADAQRQAEVGTIDPWLKTLSFWRGEQALCAFSVYAVHPMSYWGTGQVTADFPGLARERRQADDPEVFQMYGSGASGNVTAGKYNDGSPDNRPVLTRKLYEAMVAAWKATRTVPLEQADFRAAPLRLEPRNDPGFTVADLKRRLDHADTKQQSLGALGLSWRTRADAGHKLEIPALDLGAAQVLLLPGESYIEYQLYAQEQRPDSFVVTLGYGESATGYVPIERAWAESDHNLDEWCWVAPGAERAMKDAIRAAVRPAAG